ncbi:enoyl-CoA hydratase-related protein [Curvibacter delicatus]|jgi:putative two-component system hydrogenase maturation factor HypX/HoxX|uniref:enoyl-CoA hydratase-related protein n=1 Tax=Curvibacter delicatus TaxID=80879 RepID=UPI000830509F|nr:enoyl-CoA hydratase-related protein [Curvibacter delicatus]
MRILLLCHAFNSLSQRLHTVLREAGHEVSVELDIADSVTEQAVQAYAPDLLLAPFLKRRIPESVWRRLPCWVVHPGPPGDGGPNALDWAVLRALPEWGVTVLQANGDYDAGPVLAYAPFPMRNATKASLYRHEVNDAAVRAVQEALSRWQAGLDSPKVERLGCWQPPFSAGQRQIDWKRHTTDEVLCIARAADSVPGAIATLLGESLRVFDLHPATEDALAGHETAAPGAVLARRGPALLIRTVDGGVWVGAVRRAADADSQSLKLAATLALARHCTDLPELTVALQASADEWRELRYEEWGAIDARVGWLSFDFLDGAMGLRQCVQLRDALRELRQRDTRVLVLAGGADFFSNGIHLHEIEHAAQQPGDSAADASWRNIQAIDDVALEVLSMDDRLTVSALRGNAGAGGCFLAMAADLVWAHEGVVLNPHYKNMGNLFGSEYWTYTLPRRVGAELAQAITQDRLPIGTAQALRLGLVDRVFSTDAWSFESLARAAAQSLAAQPDLDARLAAKRVRRAADETHKPLASYREDELRRMHRNFFGFDPSYHVARHYFVHRKPHSWTPRHLAMHR